jgi:hypothetical protein
MEEGEPNPEQGIMEILKITHINGDGIPIKD